MFIEKFLNNGVPYLRLVENYRTTDSNGVKRVRKKTILNIGSLSKFDDGQPNFYERLKTSFKAGNPLIPVLKPYCPTSPVRERYNLTFIEGDSYCFGEPKLYSHCLIEQYLNALGIISTIAQCKKQTNIQFDVAGFVRLLIYGRILKPTSKISTARQNNDYYNEIVKDMYEYNIYDTLDFISSYKRKFVRTLNKNLKEKFNRTTNLIYYDVTNFYFEIERPDEDYEDEDGDINVGLRKNGVSKEERKLPIVQMGLFMDEQGVPISIETFPGNTLDHLTVIKSLEKSVDDLGLPRFIFVGDRGMYQGNNAAYLSQHNNGYIMSKSIQKSSKNDKDWMLDQNGFTFIGNDFKYKSRIVQRKVKTEDGTYTISEKMIVYWSKNFYNRMMAENKSLIETLEKIKENPKNFRLESIKSKQLKSFLKKEYINEKTGEVIDGKDLSAAIDYDKVNKYKSQFGYYQIVTSELEMDDQKVIDTYHGLSQIERQFQTMKSTLSTRPLYVRNPKHIEAHLFVCMVSLIIVRLIQNKIIVLKGRNNDLDWETGLSSDKIQEALNKWQVDCLDGTYYRFNGLKDSNLNLILEAHGINIPQKLFQKGELRKIKTEIKL